MSGRVLVCDDEASLRQMLQILLRRSGYEAETAYNVETSLRRIEEDEPYDAVITDLAMPDGSGMDVLAAARARSDETQVLMITAYATAGQAVEAMKLGAYDYVQKPFRNNELLATLEKALEKRAIVVENRSLRQQVQAAWSQDNIVGKSRAITELRDLVRRAAQSTTSVLITGESGTGKELVARSLHEQSARAGQPFVVLNCGAIPENLIESELFGHEKGSFTGATKSSQGLFRTADGGTLFLDEIGELPLTLQVKLLRALQERKVRPIGGHAEVTVDVRVIAATNRDLEGEVRAERFREDLFYRLNVIRVHVPPLRDRSEDVALLTEHFLRKHAAIQGRQVELDREALRWIQDHPFPGNVRELENLVERGVALAPGTLVRREDLGDRAMLRDQDAPMVIPNDGFDLEAHLANIERTLLLQAMQQCNQVRKDAAQLLGMTFRQFRYRIAKYEGGHVRDTDDGLDAPD